MPKNPLIDPWAYKQHVDAVGTARRMWGDGWALLSDEQRLATVALRAMSSIASNDDTGTDNGARAKRFRDLAALVLTEGV